MAAAAQATQNKPAPAPSGVTGLWTGTFVAKDGEREENESAHIVLKQTGAELTGSAGPNANQQWPIAKGKVETTKEGTRLTFDVQSDGPLLHFDLKLVEGRLKGNANGEMDGRKFSAVLDLQRAK